jgi:hypothetical protein
MSVHVAWATPSDPNAIRFWSPMNVAQAWQTLHLGLEEHRSRGVRRLRRDLGDRERFRQSDRDVRVVQIRVRLVPRVIDDADLSRGRVEVPNLFINVLPTDKTTGR